MISTINDRKGYVKFFERGLRTSGEKFFFLASSAPSELQQFISEVHEYFDCLPNDWIYTILVDCFNELSMDSIDDITIESDCYNSELYKWLGNSYADEFCAEALQETGIQFDTIYEVINTGQLLAKRKIYEAVNEFIMEKE